MARKKFLLIDGDSMLFKSFWGLIRQAKRFKAPNGLHTNAIYEFTNMFLKLLRKIQPDYCLVAWDAGKVTFRTKMYPDYKGNRKKAPDILHEQFKPTMKVVSALGGTNYELKNYEADDIVGTMSKKADEAGLQTIIITGDRDYEQLPSKLTTLYLSRRGISDMVKITPKWLMKNKGLTPTQIIDKKALQGDSSDNYPGVTGVGSKRADNLVKKYGSLENIYKNINKITAKSLHKHLVQDRLTALLAKKLARIDRNSPVTISLDDCKYEGIDGIAATQVFEKLAFKKFLNQIRP